MDEIQTDARNRYRYRCAFCGHTGRWLRDGATARMYLRHHQGDSRDYTPCRRLRHHAG